MNRVTSRKVLWSCTVDGRTCWYSERRRGRMGPMNTSECEQWQGVIAMRVFGELDPVEETGLNAHLGDPRLPGGGARNERDLRALGLHGSELGGPARVLHARAHEEGARGPAPRRPSAAPAAAKHATHRSSPSCWWRRRSCSCRCSPSRPRRTRASVRSPSGARHQSLRRSCSRHALGARCDASREGTPKRDRSTRSR